MWETTYKTEVCRIIAKVKTRSFDGGYDIIPDLKNGETYPFSFVLNIEADQNRGSLIKTKRNNRDTEVCQGEVYYKDLGNILFSAKIKLGPDSYKNISLDIKKDRIIYEADTVLNINVSKK